MPVDPRAPAPGAWAVTRLEVFQFKSLCQFNCDVPSDRLVGCVGPNGAGESHCGGSRAGAARGLQPDVVARPAAAKMAAAMPAGV